MKRSFQSLACTLIVVYVLLAFAAVPCLFGAEPHNRAHSHHHHSPTAHSALCAWACQANPELSLFSSAPFLQPFLLAFVTLLFRSAQASSVRLHLIRSRAPPHRSFSFFPTQR